MPLNDCKPAGDGCYPVEALVENHFRPAEVTDWTCPQCARPKIARKNGCGPLDAPPRPLVDGGSAKQAPRVQTNSLLHTKVFKTPKSFLIIHIQRLQYINRDIRKNDSVVRISESLSIGQEVYRLVSFVEHLGGGPACGHYICYRNISPGRWSRISDASVEHVACKEELLKSARPYLLFYEKN